MLQKRKNVPEDLPKMTKLMVDGKACIYIGQTTRLMTKIAVEKI